MHAMVTTAVDTAIRNYLRGIAEKNRDMVTALYRRVQAGELSQNHAMAQAARLFTGQTIGQSGYIYCIDSHGVIKVHPSDRLIDKDISENSFVQIQKEKREGYIEYAWANPDEEKKRAKALYMVYFQPWDWIISVSSYRGEFRDLLKVDDFQEQILDITFGETGYAFVMDTRGRLIIHPELQGTTIYDATDDNGRRFIQEICQQKNGRIIYPWKNPGETASRKKLVIFSYIKDLDWIVASSGYLDEFYRPLKTIGYSIVIAIIFMVMVMIPATWLISLRMAKPLRVMSGIFKKGAGTDTIDRMALGWGGEMDEVAQNYNRFVNTLEQTRGELEQARTELEERVTLRTRELSRRIRQLDRKNMESGLLRKMNEMVQVCHSPSEVFGVIEQFLIKFFPGTSGLLLIHDAHGDHLDAVASWGPSAQDLSAFAPSQCWALRQGKSHFSNKESHPVTCDHTVGLNASATLCEPMVVQGKGPGLLFVMQSKNNPVDPGANESCCLADKQGLATMICEHLGLALSNIQLQETLRQQSIQDPLTGLYNRRFMDEIMVREAGAMVRHNYTVGVLMVDVDHFKKVNDTHGHECGDAVLRELGAYIAGNVRKNDMACRYGGEEFALLLIKSGHKNTMDKASKIVKGVARDLVIHHGEISLSITISIGMSLAGPELTLEEAMTAADAALYRAKEQGRNRVACHISEDISEPPVL